MNFMQLYQQFVVSKQMLNQADIFYHPNMSSPK